MSVTSQVNRVRETGNGSKTAFDFSFPVFAAGDLEVYKVVRSTNVVTLMTINTDYTVSINSVTEGGTVTFVVAPTTLQDSLILRVVDFVQDAVLPTEGNFREDQVEAQLDLGVMRDIQLQEQIDRCIQVGIAEDTFTADDLTEAVGDAEDAAAAAAASASSAGGSASSAAASAAAAAASAAAAAASAAVFTGFVDRGDPSSTDKTLSDFTTDATWRDLDLSSIVPDGAKSILLAVRIFVNTATNGVQFRKKGNVNAKNVSYVVVPSNNTTVIQDIIVPCSTARVIQYNADNMTWTTLDVVVKGWFK